MSVLLEYYTKEQHATPIMQLCECQLQDIKCSSYRRLIAHTKVMTTGYTYPDPTTLVTQAYPSPPSTFSDALSSYNPCFQSWESHIVKGSIGTVSKKTRSKKKHSTSALKRLAPAPSPQRFEPSESNRATIAPRVSRGGKVSKLGQLRASFGGNMGYDLRRRPEVRRENGVLLSWVDNEWSTSV